MEKLTSVKKPNCLSQKIKCDCCGTETMAEIRDNKLIIVDKRHGRRHIVVLKLADLLAIMQ